jgi:dolichol-phosphate mannosyltransferase
MSPTTSDRPGPPGSQVSPRAPAAGEPPPAAGEIARRYSTTVFGGTRGLPPGTPCDRVLLAVFSFNEGVKLHTTLGRIPDGLPADVIVIDDGSTDGSTDQVDPRRAKVLKLPPIGLGAAIREAIRYARGEGYHILAIMAANDKDRPDEVPRLLAPIQDDGFYLSFGSRYLPGGVQGNMPLYRTVATRWVHPALFNLFTGARLTDTSNGFRAIHLSLFDDPAFKLDQAWLDEYEIERYIQFKAIRLGYRYIEVPVTKIYPAKGLGQTKMKPITGWWSMVKPIVMLGLRLRD